jgi:hypothetical protein
VRPSTRPLRADDGIRTRDPHLGKVMLYQLSHVRVLPGDSCPPATSQTLADTQPNPQLGNACRGAAVTSFDARSERRGRNVVACPDLVAPASVRYARSADRVSAAMLTTLFGRRSGECGHGKFPPREAARQGTGGRRQLGPPLVPAEGRRDRHGDRGAQAGQSDGPGSQARQARQAAARPPRGAGPGERCSAVGSSSRRATPHTARTR